MQAPSLTLEGDAAVEVIEMLRRANKLLFLSERQLRQNTQLTGPDLARTIASEISFHLETIEEHNYAEGRYRYPGTNSVNLETLQRDILLLMKLSSSQDKCFELLCQAFESYHWHLNAPYLMEDVEGFRKIDTTMLKIIKEDIRQREEAGKVWTPSYFFKHLMYWKKRLARNDVLIDSLEEDQWKQLGDMGVVFEKSLSYLRNWPLRRYAKTVSYKAAGRYLPTELVELIAEQFYDKELLEKLEKEE